MIYQQTEQIKQQLNEIGEMESRTSAENVRSYYKGANVDADHHLKVPEIYKKITR